MRRYEDVYRVVRFAGIWNTRNKMAKGDSEAVNEGVNEDRDRGDISGI